MPPTKPRKPTPNQLAWDKEVKRLQREMKRAEKRGQAVPTGFIPEAPARITKKQLNLIRKITLRAKKQKPEEETKKPRTKEEKTTKKRLPGTSTQATSPAKTRPKQDPQIAKEKDRIRGIISRAKKRGYETPDMSRLMSAKPEGTDTLTFLQSLRGNDLYAFFRYKIATDKQGKPIYQSGEERRREENWARVQLGIARRGASIVRDPGRDVEPNIKPEPFEPYEEPTDIEAIDAVSQYYAHLLQQLDTYETNENWTDTYKEKKTSDKTSIQEFIKTIIDREGAQTVALRIANSAENLKRHLDVIMYHSDEGDIAYSYATVATVIAGRNLTRAEAEQITEDN